MGALALRAFNHARYCVRWCVLTPDSSPAGKYSSAHRGWRHAHDGTEKGRKPHGPFHAFRQAANRAHSAVVSSTIHNHNPTLAVR